MNPRKVYAIDHGLVRACVPSPTRDLGHHFENAVYLELRRRGTVLGYHLTEAGHEVDFVFEARDGERQLVQACADLSDEATRARELRALTTASRETGIDALTIVTPGTERTERAEGREVKVVPAWRWLVE
ncbi:MAG: ATP-binding protein [Planctomycetes bacterium]|nr:ATP-binding protein [Planctomycetota bacterium]